jgi:hypothetical protein
MARPRSPLTKFILSLSHTLAMKDVIAKAKAKGLKATESNVYRVRRLAAKSAKTAPSKTKTPSAKPSPSSPTTATSSKAPQSKVGFIRSLPPSMPVAQVVSKAKAQGLKIPESYVHWARWQSKSAAKKKVRKATATVTKVTKLAARRATSPRKGASVVRPITTTSSAEDLLRAVAAEIGLGRAVGILTDERAKLRAVIGG